jgi:replicative DNA helicase
MADDASPFPRRNNRGNRSYDDAPASTIGRSPPHSVEAEEYLLSCCLIDGNDTIARCLEGKLGASSFYVAANRTIFDKLVDLYNKGTAIDLAVLAEELKTTQQLEQVGGYAYLTQISGRIPTTAQAPYFIEKIRELFLLRELIKVASTAVENCYNYQGGLEEFIDKTEQELFAVTQDRISDAAKSMKGPVTEAMGVITKMMMKKGELTGVSSGFKDLDEYTFGFQREEMIILAERPSMGKTSLALNFAEAAAMPKRGTGVTTLVFSLEMSAAQLALRMLCSRARVNMKLLRDGLLSKHGDEQQRLLQVADEFTKSPIYLDDSSHL